MAVIPDPVTCFSTAKYSQTQVFKVSSSSSLLIVDWITSGRHGRGEKWVFDLYKSTNNIFLDADEPLFLDTILLEQGSCTSIAERMQDYQVIAMVILLGPKLKFVQDQIQENVKNLMSRQLRIPLGSSNNPCLTKPSFMASCSVFGRKGRGVVVRIAAMTTESVYSFLQCQLSGLDSLLGVSPYR